MSVIHVWIVVFGDHHSVGKLAAGEGLHGFLTVCSGDVLHEDLKVNAASQTLDSGEEDQDSNLRLILTLRRKEHF